jgi:dihydroorotate dehydrogenase electron transfer subunit
MMNDSIVPPPKTKLKILKCQLIEKTWLTPTIVRQRFRSRELTQFTLPGQFVNIKVSDNFVPLLRRPFSLHRVDRGQGWVEILFQVIGTGTKLLTDFEVGNELNILGPLGNHFIIPNDCAHAILIAGGLGIAPLLFLAQELTRQNIPATLFFGNKSREFFCCLNDFEKLNISYFLATDDGSLDFKGTVTDLFLAKQAMVNKSHSIIYTCGPNPMLQKIKGIANQLILSCQVSLETMMACGFGACLSCVVNSTDLSNPYKYVCKDGPVFNASEIDLSE